MLLNELLERDAHLLLHCHWPVHMATDAEQLHEARIGGHQLEGCGRGHQLCNALPDNVTKQHVKEPTRCRTCEPCAHTAECTQSRTVYLGCSYCTYALLPAALHHPVPTAPGALELPPTFVPALFLRPKELNHEGPLRKMVGATDTVSTLVTVVGHPYKPMPAGNGGFSRGLPATVTGQEYIKEMHKCVTALSSPQHIPLAPSQQKSNPPGTAQTRKLVLIP